MVRILALVFSPFLLSGQELKEFVVHKGEVVTKVIPMEEQYRFPEFQEGQVIYFNDKSLSAKLNYSLLYGEVHFLNDEGDTLALEDGPRFKYLKIGEKLFYYAHWDGYLEEIKRNSSAKLARKQNLNIVYSMPPIKIGKYGKDDVSFREVFNRKSAGRILIKKQISYFFIDKNNRFYPAKRKNILKIFPRNKRSINSYLEENGMDFGQEEDLIRLLEFCNLLAEN